ncbi:bzip transcription factor (ap-1) [Diplodia corticola]|uniref:Bzip transcription factor (Ap-1) n=1 Tax=Diplodia corticola TaxID=236234 RepID=A0A1J9S2T5_9PEZI|nr:bzip transcription factor (ap-1) [Diplodia corticola]OJD33949.1 bzip transcription factor (ap-1) [Diplodia corticola]
MAGTTNNDPFNSHPYLSPNQQDLLMAALNSNNRGGRPAGSTNSQAKKPSDGNPSQQFLLDGLDPNFFPPDGAGAGFDNFNLEESPYVDFLDGDTGFEFDPNDTSDLLIGSLPGDQAQSSTSPDQPGADGENETGDKRKSPDDDDEEAEGGGKRREGEDKTAKKPGRKPLTSEPTTKRKAQNRAAQRAFRERKEKHLKDLETKVGELQKASDAANHENGLLRAQVERLQMELREYRKRLSSNTTGISRPSGFPSLLSHNNNNNNSPPSSNFQFEFPRFGALPGSQIFNNNGSLSNGDKSSPTAAKPATQNSAPGVLNRQGSAARSVSPTSQQNGVRSPDKASPASGSDYNSPGMNGLPRKSSGGRGSTSSSTGTQRVFQFNSHSNSSTNDSPSASSVSQYGANSSCGTSPEPSHTSPGNDRSHELSCAVTTEGETTFCEKLNMACGNPRNPIPRALSDSNGTPAATSNTNDSFGIDWLASQNNNQFNPSLFGDYREPQTAVVGDGDFTGGFFNEAFPTADFGSPFNFDNQSPGISKSNPMESIDKIQDGDDDEVVPGEDPNSLLSCHKIWDKLQNRPDFKDGSIDIDGLCTELRAKARCSESGVVVDSKDVEAALKRLPDKP